MVKDLPALQAEAEAEADVIVAKLVVAELDDVRGKVYSRDVSGGMRRAVPSCGGEPRGHGCCG